MSAIELHPDGGVVVNGVWLPDDFPLADHVHGWRCGNCKSRWMRYRHKTTTTDRIRLLHHDETCSCYGRRCACGDMETTTNPSASALHTNPGGEA